MSTVLSQISWSNNIAILSGTKTMEEGFDRTNLYHYLQFYKLYPNFVDSVSRQSMLSWTHYRILLQVFSKEARDWYEQEALIGSWSVRTLQRNVSSDYYHMLIYFEYNHIMVLVNMCLNNNMMLLK